MKHHEPRLKGRTEASGAVDVLDNRISNLGAPQAGSDAARLQDVWDGFYPGTVFRESESGGAVMVDDTLVVDSNHFYLYGSSDGKPGLSLQGNQTLEKLDVHQYIDFQELAEKPDDPAANHGRIHALDQSGFTQLHFEHAGGTPRVVTRDSIHIIKNTSGDTINEGEVVYVSGSVGNVATVAKAKADACATMPAAGIIVGANISNNAFGEMMVVGDIQQIDTSAFSEGDRVFVSATTAGALTATEPTHPNISQLVGTVTKDAVSGALHLSIAGCAGHDYGTLQTTFTIGATAANSAILSPAAITAQRTHTLPDRSGTFALTDELFYPGINVKQSDDAASFNRVKILTFNTEGFYLTQNAPNTDEVTVSLRGGAGATGPQGPQGPPGPGFYLAVKQSDDAASFSGIGVLAFSTEDFYITQNATNTDEVLVNLRGHILTDGSRPFTGQILAMDGKHNAPGISFANETDVGISRLGTAQMGLSANGLVMKIGAGYAEMQTDTSFWADDGVAAGPGYGFKSDKNTGIFRSAADTLNIACGSTEIAEFDQNSVDLSVPIFAPNLGDPFYGMTIRESESGGAAFKSDRLTFDSGGFYVSRGGDGGPLVSLIHDRDSIDIIDWTIKLDSTGDVFPEPYRTKASNDVWNRMVLVFNDTSTVIRLDGGFVVPRKFVSNPKILLNWTSTATANNVAWEFYYRVVRVGDSYDQKGFQEAVSVLDAAPANAHERVQTVLDLPAGSLLANDDIEYRLVRDGTIDNMAAAALIFGARFDYSER